MRIFASWSGQASREIAVILKDWIPNVLQDAEVYVSSQDIGKGERWLNNVNVNLQEHNFGISIVTAENYIAPWILFEAGALAKSLNGRLIPLLCGIDTIAMPNHPLTQFQYAVAPGKEEVFRFIQDINTASDKPLSDERLKATFEKWYPDFLTSYENVDFGKTSKDQSKKADFGAVEAVLSELMREVRDLRTQVGKRPPEPPTLKPVIDKKFFQDRVVFTQNRRFTQKPKAPAKVFEEDDEQDDLK